MTGREQQQDISWRVVIRDFLVAALDAAKANPIMAASVGSFPFSVYAVAAGKDRHWEARNIVNAHWNNAANMTFPQIATPLFSFGGSQAPRVQPASQDIGRIVTALLAKKNEK